MIFFSWSNEQDSVQVHLKAGRAPIAVLTCELGSCDAPTGGSFLTLEESVIRTTSLHTGVSVDVCAVLVIESLGFSPASPK